MGRLSHELTLREQERRAYYKSLETPPHKKRTVEKGPERFPAGRRCECNAPLSIYNPGPDCRKCARTLKVKETYN